VQYAGTEISQKIEHFVITAVRTSNPTSKSKVTRPELYKKNCHNQVLKHSMKYWAQNISETWKDTLLKFG
jgi:hypothetical protein